jgi:hypothetical protein
MEGLIAGVSAGTTATVTLFVLRALVQVFQTLNHQQCRSKCCGTTLEMALDVDKTPRAARVDEAIAHVLAEPSPPRPARSSMHIGIPKE